MIAAREAKFERDYAYARKAGEHLWNAVAQFAVSRKQLETSGTKEMPLDAENLYGVALGCYICEAVYEPRLLYRRCPGEPTGGQE